MFLKSETVALFNGAKAGVSGPSGITAFLIRTVLRGKSQMLSSFFRFLVFSYGSGSSPGGPTNFNSVKNPHSEGARGSLQVRVTLLPRTLTSFNNPC